VLVVLLAAAAHDDQVPAVRHDRGARAAAFRADEEPAGRAEAEDRDHGLGQLVLRAVDVPAGAVVVVAVPVHPQARVGPLVVRGQDLGEVVQDRQGRVGDDGILGRQPRFGDHPGVHPARALFPGGLLHQRLHELAVAGQPALDVVDPGGVVELDPLRRGERLVDGHVQAAGPFQIGVRCVGQREQRLFDQRHDLFNPSRRTF
jgi:hypothetical protein